MTDPSADAALPTSIVVQAKTGCAAPKQSTNRIAITVRFIDDPPIYYPQVPRIIFYCKFAPFPRAFRYCSVLWAAFSLRL